MTDSIEIGRVVMHFLLQDTRISEYIGRKVYPIVADQGTKLPFVVYRRNALTLAENKDRCNQIAMVDVIVAAKTYKESVDLAVAIKNCLHHKRGQLDTVKINQIDLTNSYEDYVSEQDLFMQNLTFKIEII